MNHDVFVSYSTKDKAVADAIVAKLENQGVRCWYAPRDIPPGEEWAAVISDAIAASEVMLLVFSKNANRSQHVLDELNLAISEQIKILPFRIENLDPSGAMRLHLSSRHWLDAFSPSWRPHLDRLVESVRSMVEVPAVATDETTPESEEVSSPNPVLTGPVISRGRLFALGSILVMIALAGGLWLWGPFGKGSAQDRSVAQVGVTATQEAAATMEPEPSATVMLDPSPTANGDSREIVYLGDPGSPFEEDRPTDLYLSSVDRTVYRQLTDDGNYKESPSFSPDGITILFAWEKMDNSDTDIFLIEKDGSNLKQLTSNNWADRDPAFSPDGDEIIFVSDQSGLSDVYVMNIYGVDVRRLTQTPNAVERHPVFSPDGQRVAFASDRDGDFEIFVMNRDGSGLQQVTDNNWDDLEPVFHPVNGDRLLFYSVRSDITNLPNYVISTINASGEGLEEIATVENARPSPAFSPDGSQILYIDMVVPGEWEYFLMEADGSNVRDIYVWDEDAREPAFNPAQ